MRRVAWSEGFGVCLQNRRHRRSEWLTQFRTTIFVVSVENPGQTKYLIPFVGLERKAPARNTFMPNARKLNADEHTAYYRTKSASCSYAQFDV